MMGCERLVKEKRVHALPLPDYRKKLTVMGSTLLLAIIGPSGPMIKIVESRVESRGLH